jgi:hypothetical protein
VEEPLVSATPQSTNGATPPLASHAAPPVPRRAPEPVLRLSPNELKEVFMLLDNMQHQMETMITATKQILVAKFQVQNPQPPPSQP